jgi:hypothetical protein
MVIQELRSSGSFLVRIPILKVLVRLQVQISTEPNAASGLR